MAADVEAWNAIWYIPAWYGYLILLDAFLLQRRGRSFITHRRRELAAMLFWSTPFWFLFEAYNLRLENWFYVFALRSPESRLAMAWIAFATVLPACFMHTELLRPVRWFDSLQCRRVPITDRLQWGLLLLGLLLSALPLLWPRYFFWTIWGGPLVIADLANYRLGAPSLLRDLESGRPARLARLLVGGFLAGAVWEGLNYWARCKWIYTVPGFEDHKLFEMPILGFLGFPLLALEAFAVYTLVCHFLREGRSWEVDDRQQQRPKASLRLATAGILAVGLSLIVHAVMEARTIHSLRPLLSELTALDESSRLRLGEIGITTAEKLHRAIASQGAPALGLRSGVDPGRLQSAASQAALALHKGMGAAAAELLQSAGIADVSDLVDKDPAKLESALRAAAARNDQAPPRLGQIKVWLRAASADGRPKR